MSTPFSRESLGPSELPTRSPAPLNHQQAHHIKRNTGEQKKGLLVGECINNKLNSDNACSADLASHQIIGRGRAGARTGVEVDDQRVVDCEEGCGTVREKVLEDD